MILSEIVNLNIKGYISIEYNKQGLNKYDYTIKQIIDLNSEELSKKEMIIIAFLFPDKMEITKKELERKLNNLFKLYHIQYNELQEVINEEAIGNKIISKYQKERLRKIKRIYFLESVLFVSLVLVLKAATVIDTQWLFVVMLGFEKLVSCKLLSMASEFTNKGQILKYNIEKYKYKLEKEVFLIDLKSMEKHLKDKNFANSIALHIDSDAKYVFVDDLIYDNAVKKSKKVGLAIFIISVCLLIGILAFSFAVISFSNTAIVWIFIILSIVIAVLADVVYLLSNKNKRKL